MHVVAAGVTTSGVVVLLLVLAVGTAFGMWRRGRDGRVRPPTGDPARWPTPDGSTGGWELVGHRPKAAERVLLLQLSSPVCAPCGQTAALLADWVARTPGTVHRQLDVAEAPEVARLLGVRRTPTVVAFDRSGRELLRVSGVPRLAELSAGLAGALGTGPAGG